MTNHYMTSMLNLQRACIEKGVDLVVKLLGHDSLIPRARNILVSQFLDDPQATHLLFIDADIGFAPERAFALLEAVYDVAGAVYPMKMLDWSRIAAQAKSNAPQLKSSALNYVVDFLDPAKPEIQGNFARVRHVGTGFMMIKRAVFERMAAHYPSLRFNGYRQNTNRELNSPNTFTFFDTMIDPDDGDYLSEDYAFCRRWVDMGGAIWADASSKLVHVGTVPFEGDLPSMLATLGKSPPAAR